MEKKRSGSPRRSITHTVLSMHISVSVFSPSARGTSPGLSLCSNAALSSAGFITSLTLVPRDRSGPGLRLCLCRPCRRGLAAAGAGGAEGCLNGDHGRLFAAGGLCERSLFADRPHAGGGPTRWACPRPLPVPIRSGAPGVGPAAPRGDRRPSGPPGDRAGRTSLPAGPRPGRGTRHASARGPLPSRPRHLA